jgi:hypothetical protein
MNKYVGKQNSRRWVDPAPTSAQTAKMNRERLAVAERAAIMDEVAKKEIAVRENMVRLRELRLAKEAETARTEIATEKRSATAKPKRRFR